MNKIAAIHQPNFFPWLGFFNKVFRSDIFVILDNVQFPKRSYGCFTNRVQILVNKEPYWITVPISRNYEGFKNINEMEIDNSKNWREKIIRMIKINYAKAEYFKVIFPVIQELIRFDTSNLTAYNSNIIFNLFRVLEIKKEIYISSNLITEGKATDLNISILKAINADSYICGAGSANYQEDHKFEQNNIKLIKQDYRHPVYRQFNTEKFEKGLSVIDALMNTGIEGTKELIKQG